MVAIPTFIYLGDEQINGGPSNVRAPSEGATSALLGGLHGIYRNWPQFSQSVPCDPSTGLPPGSPAYFPFWDGVRAVAWGTAASSTANTLSVAGTPWTPSAFITGGTYTVVITGGTGSGQIRTITANTSSQLTVSSNWATNPDGTSTFEVRLGAWVVFHHTNSRSPYMLFPVVPGAHGDNWYEFGGGITPCSMLMQKLAERFGSGSPYFAGFKLATNGGVGSGASPYIVTGTSTSGVSWTNFLAEWAKAVTGLGGNTADVRCVIVDASSTDINAVNLNYAADIQALVTKVRAQFATALILLVSHHRDMMRTTCPNVAYEAHGIHVAVAAANANVRVFDMNWALFGSSAPTTSPVMPADPRYYDTESYIQAGVRIFNAWDAWQTAAPAAVAGKGIAVVAMVTDSQGSTISPQQAVYGRQSSILGAVGGTVRAGQYIYNGQTRTVELYDALANAQTTPAASVLMGFEVTLLKALAAQFPDGVVVFKFTKNGAAVTSEAKAAGATGAYEAGANDLLPDLIEHWNDCKASIIEDLDRTADVQAIVLALGDNETMSGTVASAFGGKAAQFVDDLRDVFTTRAGSPELAVVWLQPPAHISTVGGQSNLGQPAARATVREALVTLESDRDRVTVLRSNAARYELQRDDGVIHYGAEAIYALGYDIAEEVLDLNDASRLQTVTVAEDDGDDDTADPLGAIAEAMADAPDVQSYSTPDGVQVSRRSVDDLIKLEQYQQAKAARASGLRRTLARFD